MSIIGYDFLCIFSILGETDWPMASYMKKYRKWSKKVNDWLNEDISAHEHRCESENCCVDGSLAGGSNVQSEVSSDSDHENPACVVDDHGADFELQSRDSDNSTPVCSSDEDIEMWPGGDNLESSLQSDLAKWVADSHLPRTRCNELLAVLRKHGCKLPKDRRTLVATPQTVDVKHICGGQYVYFGLKKCMHVVACGGSKCDCLRVQLNVDGIPLHKASNTQFWPILCSLNNSLPMIVALYLGNSKPTCVDEFFSDLVQEFNELSQNGFTCTLCEGGSVNTPVQLHSVVCDAPARAFLKNIKGHTSINACERCKAVGVSCNSRIVFTDSSCFSADKRTNDEFNSGAYIGSHQIGTTPLSLISHDCVDICALDYMHLICLGVMRRLLQYWKSGDRNVKLGSRQLLEISQTLVEFRQCIPSEFARRPRSLVELDRWKATEYRQFLLYTGPVVLKRVLPEELYEHFLCLSVSVSILLSSNSHWRTSLLNYASKLIHYFVFNCERLYGKNFVVYNIHSLLHVADDVRYFDASLNDISAFRYENYLQTLKRLIRGASNPLVQVSKRLQEYESVQSRPFAAHHEELKLKLSCQGRDSVVFLKNGQFAEVSEINGEYIVCSVYEKHLLQSFYSKPCSSELIDTYYVGKHMRRKRKELHVTDIECKAVRFPFSGGFVVLRLRHQED